VPAIKYTAKEKGKKILQNEEEDLSPTPVPVLQSIGVNLCGIHPSEVSSQKLLTEEVENEDNIQ
jgi:hypothetical protein